MHRQAHRHLGLRPAGRWHDRLGAGGQVGDRGAPPTAPPPGGSRLTRPRPPSPLLTWRDLQHLVVRASRPAQLQAEDWRINGVGRQGAAGPGKGRGCRARRAGDGYPSRAVSHHYGYGLLDAGLLVDLARVWLPTKPQKKCTIRVVHTPT